MRKAKVFTLRASHRVEYSFAIIFGALAIKEIFGQAPNYMFFGIHSLMAFICLSKAWPFGTKEYQIQIDPSTIEFSEWIVKKKPVSLTWDSIREIRKQTVWSHPYGIGARARFRFTMENGEVVYLSKNFGQEFEDELIRIASLKKIKFIL